MTSLRRTLRLQKLGALALSVLCVVVAAADAVEGTGIVAILAGAGAAAFVFIFLDALRDLRRLAAVERLRPGATIDDLEQLLDDAERSAVQ